MGNLLPALIYALILSAKAVAALIYSRRAEPDTERASQDDVTIMQAILSGDPGLPAVLESNLRALPHATFVWLIDEDDAEGLAITGRIKARYPDRNIITQTTPPPPDTVNPKLFKLESAWRSVTTEVCVVLDDDTRLPQKTLDKLVSELRKGDLSTALPFYPAKSQNPVSGLVSQFVNNNSALTYLSLPLFIQPISINGMCYALKLNTLRRLGGFAPLLNHLADDLAVAEHVKNNGGKIRQVAAHLEVETHVASLKDYWSQMHRWFLFATLLMRRQSIPINIVIAILHGLPPLLLWTILAQTLASPSYLSVACLLTVMILRTLTLASLQRFVSGQVRHRIVLSFVSELLQPIHLLHAAVNRHIQWRTRKYRVYDNDHFVSR